MWQPCWNECRWADIASIFWCHAAPFATHSLLSEWKTPCGLQKENLTLSIKTSTTQRWNPILLTSPSSSSPSLPPSLSAPFFLSLCTRPLTRTVPLVWSPSFLLCYHWRRWKTSTCAYILFFALRPPIVHRSPLSLAASPGVTSKIGHRGSHLGCVMNSPHNCLCHHVDFSIDTASLLFRVLSLNSKQLFVHDWKLSMLGTENASEHVQSPRVYYPDFPMAHIRFYIFTSGVHGHRHTSLIKSTVGTIRHGGSSYFWEMWVNWVMPWQSSEAPVPDGKKPNSPHRPLRPHEPGRGSISRYSAIFIVTLVS